MPVTVVRRNPVPTQLKYSNLCDGEAFSLSGSDKLYIKLTGKTSVCICGLGDANTTFTCPVAEEVIVTPVDVKIEWCASSGL